MSILAMTWAWGLSVLDPSQKIVLLSLADQANDEGYCWPSQQVIAERTSMGERTVRRHINSLSELGLLTVEVRSSTSGRRSNVYWLNVGFSPEFRQSANLAGCDEPVDDSSVGNAGGSSVSVEIPATGQSGRLRKRPDWPVAQAATGDRSQPANGGRLHRGTPMKNHQTGPDRRGAQSAHDVDDDASVRSAPVGNPREVDPASSAAPTRRAPSRTVKLSKADRAVLGAFLPEPMLALDPAGAANVVRMLRERSEAGWTPAQVRRLMDQPLPESVGRMSSLVASRLERNVPVDGAPVKAVGLSEDELHAARQRRADALAGTVRPERPGRADEAVWAQVRAEMPGASRLEQAMEVNSRLAAAPTDQGGGSHD